MLYIGNISEINEEKLYKNSLTLDEIWLIVRKPDEIPDFVRHVPELSPSPELFKKYREAFHAGQFDWEFFHQVYVPQFLKELAANEEALEQLKILVKASRKKNILLACYCEEEALCHRSIVAGVLLGLGAEIEADPVYCQYYRTFCTYREPVKNISEAGAALHAAENIEAEIVCQAAENRWEKNYTEENCLENTIEVWTEVDYYNHHTPWNPAGAKLIQTVPITGFDKLIRSANAPAAWLLYRNANGFFRVLELKDGTQLLVSGVVRVHKRLDEIPERDDYNRSYKYRIEEKTLLEHEELERKSVQIFYPEDLQIIKHESGFSYAEVCCSEDSEFNKYLKGLEQENPDEFQTFSAEVPAEILKRCRENDVYGTYGRNVWFWWHEEDASFHIFGQGKIDATLKIDGEYFNTLCMYLCNCGEVKQVIFEPGITSADQGDVFAFPYIFFDEDTYELDRLVLPEGMENIPDWGERKVKELKLPHSISSIKPFYELVTDMGGHYDPVWFKVHHLTLPSDIQLGETFTLYEPAQYLKIIEFYGEEPVKNLEMLCEAGLFCNGAGRLNAKILYPREWDAKAGGTENAFARKVVDYLHTRGTGWPKSYWCWDAYDLKESNLESWMSECPHPIGEEDRWADEDYQEVFDSFQWSDRESCRPQPEKCVFEKSCLEILQDLEAKEQLFGQEFLEALQMGVADDDTWVLTLDECPPVTFDPYREFYDCATSTQWELNLEKKYLTLVGYIFWLYCCFQQKKSANDELLDAWEFVRQLRVHTTVAKFHFNMNNGQWNGDAQAYIAALIQAIKAEHFGLQDSDAGQTEAMNCWEKNPGPECIADAAFRREMYECEDAKLPGTIEALKGIIDKMDPDHQFALMVQLNGLISNLIAELDSSENM